MLIVTRHKGQRIFIGDGIELVVTEIGRNSVKIGINAPPSMLIMRGEIRESVEAANRDAALSTIDIPQLRVNSSEKG